VTVKQVPVTVKQGVPKAEVVAVLSAKSGFLTSRLKREWVGRVGIPQKA